jgi:fimbrial chaperone protein
VSTTGRLPAHAALLLALVALVGAPTAARAAELSVSPILVELSARTPTALLTLRNEGARPVRLQVQTHAWSQDATGEMALPATQELVAYPPILELAPGASRNVRIGTTARTDAAERSFRLIVEELPAAQTDAAGAAVHVLTRLSIPVFVAPVAPQAKAELSATREGRRVRFTLRNTGTVRVRPSSIRAALRGDDDRALETREEQAWYVLAGGVRDYEIEVPATTCPATRRVELTVLLEHETLTASAPVPPDACRP